MTYPEYKNITLDNIREAVSDYFYREERSINLYTGPGGADLFDETFELVAGGYKRVYYGRKPMRIIRKVHGPFRKSRSGKWFKLVAKR